MEQELATGLGKRQISQFVQDQKVEAGDQVGCPALAFCAGFRVQLVHQVDDIEEPAPAPSPDAGSGDADGKMGFAGAGAPDQHEVALVVEEVPGGQVADQGLIGLGGFEVELLQFLGERQFSDGHLVFDRPRLLLPDLGGQKVTDDLLGLMLAFYGSGQDLVIGGPHSVEPQFPRRAGGTLSA